MAYFKGKELLLVGLKGRTGDTGGPGPRGEKGDKGDKGDTGNPGVYVGSGDMPDDCNVQIDPDGDPISIDDIITEIAGMIGGDMIERVSDLEKTVDELVADSLYKEIAITKYTMDQTSLYELGKVLTVNLHWEFSKTPTSIKLNGQEQALDSTGTTISNVTTTKTWTLTVTDERGATASSSKTITFRNGIYYGTAAAPSLIDSAFILGLTKDMKFSRTSNPSDTYEFTVTADEDEYIYFCVPVRYGTCTFSVNGFVGGFVLADTVSFTNGSDYTENYYVYRSVNIGLNTVPVVAKVS